MFSHSIYLSFFYFLFFLHTFLRNINRNFLGRIIWKTARGIGVTIYYLENIIHCYMEYFEASLITEIGVTKKRVYLTKSLFLFESTSIFLIVSVRFCFSFVYYV